jgi:hypothetical protein
MARFQLRDVPTLSKSVIDVARKNNSSLVEARMILAKELSFTASNVGSVYRIPDPATLRRSVNQIFFLRDTAPRFSPPRHILFSRLKVLQLQNTSLRNSQWQTKLSPLSLLAGYPRLPKAKFEIFTKSTKRLFCSSHQTESQHMM